MTEEKGVREVTRPIVTKVGNTIIEGRGPMPIEAERLTVKALKQYMQDMKDQKGGYHPANVNQPPRVPSKESIQKLIGATSPVDKQKTKI